MHTTHESHRMHTAGSRRWRNGALLFAMVGASACAPGPVRATPPQPATCQPPFAVGTLALTVNDPARANRAIALRVHYPATAAGSGSPAISGCDFPLIAFGHGFTIANSAYGYLADGLAADGRVVVLPGSESGFAPDHAAFGADLAFSLQALPLQSAFVGVTGNARVIGGHSMGGGAAFLGAGGVSALFALAPAETNPSAITAAAGIGVPALLITGSRDCVTPLASHAGPMYAALATPAAQKSLQTIDGASHCQFTTGSVTCSIGESSCGGSATITVGDQQAATLALLRPWLQGVIGSGDSLLRDGFE